MDLRMAVPLSSPPSLETTCAACSFFRWREALSLVLPQVIVFAPLFALYRERRTTVRVNLKFLHITPSDPHKTSNNGFRITLCPPLQNLLRIKILILNLCLSRYLLYGCETDFSELAKKAVYSEVFTSKLLLLRIRFLRKDSFSLSPSFALGREGTAKQGIKESYKCIFV